MEFISENCICGQNILQLVARGNSIIAELMRLSSYVPRPFRSPANADERKERENYEDVLPSFSYLKHREFFENRISSSDKLSSLNEELKLCHLSIIERIYSTFESILRYITDLNVYINELNNGIYVQRSLESIMNDADGKQLLCEALYLYGVMLLTVDLLFPGPTRERILVFNLRHIVEKASSVTSIDSVCKLLRSTDFQDSGKIPASYPEKFFKRVAINENYVASVIECLQFEDIYHQVQTYPLTTHRTTAYASQASLLYVCLFFAPNILHKQDNRMREIVDKFFSDNWVISYYMGWTASLMDSWNSYSSAIQALQNTIELKSVKEDVRTKRENFVDLRNKTNDLLSDGPLSERKVLKKSSSILKLLRECNVTLKWLILHTSHRKHAAESKKALSLRKEVVAELQLSPKRDDAFSAKDLFDLLFNTANIELSFAASYKKLVKEKESSWLEYKEVCHGHVLELSQEFTDSRRIAKVKKNERLSQWFKNIATQILNLDLVNPAVSQQNIIQICQNMNEVKEFHNLKHSAGTIQAMNEIVEYLQLMDKVLLLEEENLVVLAVIADMSYSWQLIEEYTPTMQNSIKNDPYQVERLRAVFLKLSSGLELPLLRINQARSPDMASVSAYYSGVVVEYIKTVLQVIPKSMLEILKKVVDLQTSMQTVPVTLEKIKISEFSQLEKRHKMSELTENVAVLAGGITMMKSTLVGIVKIDPKELLEEGVRRELFDQVYQTLSHGFTFKSKKKCLQSSLAEVKRIMIGFQSSFEYIQDYLGINCLKLWQVELKRLISLYVEQELNELVKLYRKGKYFEDISRNWTFAKSKSIPSDFIPVNFMGRLTEEILRLSNPRTSFYVPEARSWFDMRNRTTLMSHTVMKDVMSCIGVPGIIGLKKILSFSTAKTLEEVIYIINKIFSNVHEIRSVLEEVRTGFHSSFLIDDVQNLVIKLVQRIGKQYKFCVILMDKMMHIGNMQILQELTSAELNTECKVHSKLLSSVVENMNKSVLLNMKRIEKSQNTLQSDKDCCFATKLTDQSVNCGLDEPLKNIYVARAPINFLAESILICIITQMNKIFVHKYPEYFKDYDAIDGSALVIGIATTMNQFHRSEVKKLLTYLSQYSQSIIASTSASNFSGIRLKEYSSETLPTIHIIKKLAAYYDLQISALHANILPHLASF